jgi:alginate O-acetyltransferase complex protein AlgI
MAFVLAWGLLFFVSPAKFRPFVLLLSNFVFYGFFSFPILCLIVTCSSADFIVSKLIAQSGSIKRKKVLLFGAISYNVLLLVLFKYSNWLLSVAAHIASIVGIDCGARMHLDLILPLGISFYTLESISYLVDVYRGSAPAKSWWHYNLYMMWFPHLLAGPIVRFCKLSEQYINGIERPSLSRVKEGFLLILFGCVGKVVVADFAASVADPIFNNPGQQGALITAAGFLAFGTQLLWDFWGYSQIARGISLLFNIELPVNFNRPFTAKNLADFWQRWHISLSQWLHDYVFLPLGGRTRNLQKSMIAVSITMFVAGLWHGANTKYLALGLYFAVGISAYHLYRRCRHRIFGKSESALLRSHFYGSACWCLTQAYVIIGASFLRVPNLNTLSSMLQKFGQRSDILQDALTSGGRSALFCITMFWILSWVPFRRIYNDHFVRIPSFVQAPAFACVIALCWICAAQTPKPFIYFQF